MSLRGKRILITAGPTWVPIDNVRVISNIATGRTGILLAERLQHLGAKVTLLLGPVECGLDNKKIKVICFKFSDELLATIKTELKKRHYDFFIHTAAVSDYKPKAYYKQKVKSGLRHWNLKLIPTIKIIDLIKKIDSNVFLVSFKFAPQTSRARLIKQAKILMRSSSSDLVVANTVYNNNYNAWVVGSSGKVSKVHRSRSELVGHLIRIFRLISLNRRGKR